MIVINFSIICSSGSKGSSGSSGSNSTIAVLAGLMGLYCLELKVGIEKIYFIFSLFYFIYQKGFCDQEFNNLC